MESPSPKLQKILGGTLLAITSLTLEKYLRTAPIDTGPAVTSSNRPFSLQTTISVTGSVIDLVGKTTAPENSVFQVFANRELISTENGKIKMSMLPHVGDSIYESPIEYSGDEEPNANDPRNFYGLVKNGMIKSKVIMYHPYIQAAGQSRDSSNYRFDKFDLVTFKIKILKTTQHPPAKVDDFTSENWVNFKDVKSIPIPIYQKSPSAAEIKLIQDLHNKWCPGLGPDLSDDGRCNPVNRPN